MHFSTIKIEFNENNWVCGIRSRDRMVVETDIVQRHFIAQSDRDVSFTLSNSFMVSPTT